MKKIFIVLLMVLMVFSSLFAAGRTQQSGGATGTVTAAPGQFPLTANKANLSVLIRKVSYLSDLNNNLATDLH